MKLFRKLLEFMKTKFWRGLFSSKIQNKVKKIVRKRKDKEHFGTHYYLSDLLDVMPRAFLGLNMLQKTDPEVHKLFSKTGCAIVSKDMRMATTKSGYIDFKNAPSFGCAHLVGEVHDDDYEGACPIICYFNKIKRPFNVQPSNDTIYEFGVVYDTEHLAGFPPAMLDKVYMSVDEEGALKALKTCRPTWLRVGNSSFSRMTWKYPELLERYAEQWGNTDIEGVASWWFNIISHLAMSTESGLTVRVKKKKSVISFAIDMERTPYFFSDREKVVTSKGQTKKIFHVVRGHMRKMSDGTEKHIKSHFRGLRKFVWNGYDVSISLTGKHHNSMFSYTGDIELAASAEDQEARIKSGRYVDSETLGKRMYEYYA
jgi:hypothetical protein